MASPHQRLERLYDEHGSAVRAYARRRAGADLADEVLSETFLVAWRRLDDVPAGAERPWLLGVARRVLSNQLRGERRRGALGERLEREHDVRPAADEGQAVHDVALALSRLPEGQREVVMLVYWDGLTPAEAAAVLASTSLAVRARLHRALKALRGDLGDHRPASALHPLTPTEGRHARQ